MLQRNGKETKTYGFICAVELEDGVDVTYIAERLAGGLTFIEGVGEVDVECLGEIDVLPEEGDEEFLQGAVEVTKKEMH